MDNGFSVAMMTYAVSAVISFFTAGIIVIMVKSLSLFSKKK